MNVKPFVCDVSCDTNDLSDYRIEKCDFAEIVFKKECKDEHENCNDNTSLKIMEIMSFKGKCLGKDEHELMNLIYS